MYQMWEEVRFSCLSDQKATMCLRLVCLKTTRLRLSERKKISQVEVSNPAQKNFIRVFYWKKGWKFFYRNITQDLFFAIFSRRKILVTDTNGNKFATLSLCLHDVHHTKSCCHLFPDAFCIQIKLSGTGSRFAIPVKIKLNTIYLVLKMQEWSMIK